MSSIPKYDVCFEFISKVDDSTLKLTYRLYDRDFSVRWLKLLKRAIDKNIPVQDNGVFYGTALNTEEDCVADMKETVNQINLYIAKNDLKEHHIELEAHTNMSQEFLNDMHKRFEILRHEQGFEGENIQRHLANLNTEVHRSEGFLNKGFKGCHVEVNFDQVEYGDFEEDDYKLFTPDKKFGTLNLTYGVTGVPVEAAFYAKPKDPPMPQPNYCSGSTLYFNDTYDFPFWDELEKYLKESWDLDVKDPKLAIGYISLGELITPYRSREELVKQIATHQQLGKISLISREYENETTSEEGNHNVFQNVLDKIGLKKKAPFKTKKSLSETIIATSYTDDIPPAIWPSHPEIQHHLNYKAYIELDIKFDTSKMFEEAFAVADKFVSHRNYAVISDRDSEWKSVGLHAIEGDYTKTAYHTNYGVTGNPNYRLTEIANQCPETIKFLSNITDIKQCERVRFMLLEPGAKIHVHHDSDDDVCTAVNISLNMPDGCRFVADANEDGSSNAYTVELPFKDAGSVILFNNSKYHFVENNSDQPRMHIIFHGPIRYGEKSIIQDAQKQNGFNNDREVLQALIRKKYELGEEIKPESDFYKDWKTLGISADIIPDELKLIVVDETLEDKKFQEECLYKITGASIFPLQFEIVNAKNLDKWMSELKVDINHLIIIGAGTLIDDVNRFTLEMFRTIAQMSCEKIMISGQIINQKDELPYLHEQFLILDYKLWKENGAIALGERYGAEEIDFPGFKASTENIHDDYTPLFLEKDLSSNPKTGKNWWGTALLAANIKNEIKVLNVSQGLRKTKKYAYPTATEKWQYEEIVRNINDKLDYINRQVFFFNNELLNVRQLDFQPTRFITVAAGFKPIGILHQYWKNSQAESIFAIDYSEKAIEYFKKSVNAENPTALFNHIVGFMSAHPYGSVLDENGVRNHLKALLAECFDNDVALLMAELQQFKQATFSHADFIQNPQATVDLFDQAHPTLFWHSNAWSCNGIFYKMTPAEIEKSYFNLVNLIKAKLQLNAWKNKNSYEVIFGESLTNIHSFITEGSPGGLPDENEWAAL